MKKFNFIHLILLLAVISLVFGCAVFGPKTMVTASGYKYTSTVDPQAMDDGKYPTIKGEMISPFTTIVVFHQPEKDRVVVGIYTMVEIVEGTGLKMTLVRFMYREGNELMVFDVDPEKKEWVRRTAKDLEITDSDIKEIFLQMEMDLKEYKEELDVQNKAKPGGAVWQQTGKMSVPVLRVQHLL